MQIRPDFSTEKFREVVTLMTERRALLKPGTGTFLQRIARAQVELNVQRPRKIALLEKYLSVWCAHNHDAAYQKKLEYIISSLDRELQIDERAAAYIASVLFLAWRCGMDSPSICAVVGGGVLTPVLARQWLHRSRNIAAGFTAKGKCRIGERRNYAPGRKAGVKQAL